MDNINKDEIIFDTMLKSAFLQYVEDKYSSYPTDEVLEKLYPVPKKGLKRVKKEFKRRKRAQKRSRLRTLGIIAIILASVITVCTALMLIPTARSAVTGFTENLFGINITPNSDRENNRTPPSISDDTSADNELVYDYEIPYIPDGYVQSENSVSQNKGYYTYFDDNGRYIYISISPAYMTSVSLNKDSFDHDKLEINGRECHLAYNADKSYGTAIISDGDFVVQIDAIVERQEIIKIAEAILSSAPEIGSENAPPINLY